MCIHCGQASAASSALCEECAEHLRGDAEIVPEQISSPTQERPLALLVDRFGSLHPVTDGAVIGRRRELATIVAACDGISRHHARLMRTRADQWVVEDLGSTNGTFVNDRRVDRSALRFGDILRVAGVAMYFEAPPARFELRVPASTQTAPSPPLRDNEVTKIRASATPRIYEVGRETWELAARDGHSGVLLIGDRSLRLTRPQLELIALLLERWQAERALPGAARGFVPTAELIQSISWDTPHADEDNVKHLVRRVRRSLVRSGVAGAIESRAGFGYRISLERIEEPQS